MKFFTDFFKAIGNCFKAFSVIFEKGLWPYSFVFLVVWILLWVLSIYGLFVLADGISDWLSSYMDFNSIPETGHWQSSTIGGWADAFECVTDVSKHHLLVDI